MKNIFFFLIAGSFLIACNNNKKSDEPPAEEFILQERAEAMMWRADMDSVGRLYMRHDMPAQLISNSIEYVTKYLNDTWPKVQLLFLKTSNDTAYFKIPESTYLTQQMGSTGPVEYFATVVYNITEIPGLRYVNFDFEEGDHAAPEVLNRESFKDN